MSVIQSQAWPAPAKLNLFLHITGRRADGYHTLQTVFQFIDRCDKLYFGVRQDGEIHRTSDLQDVEPEHDLVVRAARLLQQEAGIHQGADLRVEKNLPLGGGLGGGSSDAATTLVALNALWGIDMHQDRLAELGLQLGADVPVFILGQAAWAEGVGEQLTPIELIEPWFVVLMPPCHVSTAEVFNAAELTRDCHPITIEGFLSGQGCNICEAFVRERFIEVAEALDWLAQYSSNEIWGEPRMSGTGACVFAAFEQEAAAQAVIRQLPNNWQGFVARGMNRSPLLDVLAKVSHRTERQR